VFWHLLFEYPPALKADVVWCTQNRIWWTNYLPHGLQSNKTAVNEMKKFLKSMFQCYIVSLAEWKFDHLVGIVGLCRESALVWNGGKGGQHRRKGLMVTEQNFSGGIESYSQWSNHTHLYTITTKRCTQRTIQRPTCSNWCNPQLDIFAKDWAGTDTI